MIVRYQGWGPASLVMVCLCLAATPARAQQQSQASEPPLTFEELAERARAESNVRTEVWRARLGQARARQQAARAALLPQVRVDATGTRNGQQIEVGGRVFQPQYNWSANGNASVTIFDGSIYPTYTRSKVLVDQTELQNEWLARSLSFEIEQAALLLLAAEQSVVITEETIALRQEDVAQAKALVAAQSAVPIDVARAQAQLLIAERALLDAQQNVADAAAALEILLGESPDASVTIAGALGERAALGDEDLLDLKALQQLERRPDVRALNLGVEVTELAYDSVWWSLFPQLSLSANGIFGPQTISNPDGFFWSVSLNASWLIYDGGARYARLDELDEQVRELEASRRVAILEALDEVGQVRREWETSSSRVQVAQRQVDVAERALVLARRRFEAGVATSLEVRDASQDLFNAELDLNAATLALAAAKARARYLLEALEMR